MYMPREGKRWIFFKKPILASLARNFGYLLLDRGQSLINMKSFQYYDRMYPCQDRVNSIGNLIALPLQGRALKNGNSAFVDSNWNAYPDQWDILLNHTMKLSMEEIVAFMKKWKAEITEATGVVTDDMECRPKPWKKKQVFNKSDVVGKMHIILGDGVYVDALNLMPRIQNQIRSLAAFDNPIFYKNRRLGYSNYYNFSSVYMGKDIDGYIRIPRGLREQLINNCKEACIEYEISDQREMGRPIRVFFNGDLRTEQDLAANRMLQHDHGVLSATTAFGKTVVCSYLISQRKVSTLILLHSKDLIEQWVEELNKFLIIKEKPPIYKTKTGREKRRDSVIGVLTGNKNTITGIVDVAMIGSMYSKGKFNDFINSYGLVIMDECHHCGSNTSIEVMERVNSRYVYGVSATPKRGDNLEKIVYMLLGPIRHSYTAKERAKEQGIGYYVYPRFTRVIDTNETRNDISAAYNLISNNKLRNEMIVNDTRQVIADGRTPLILTRYKEQAKNLFDILSGAADYVFLLYGDNSDRENSEIRKKLKEVLCEKSIILIATGQKIGEGFDFPRLDTLMLAAPVSFDGRLEQYVGRLHRDYEGKKYVVVYDYIDAHLKVFEKMYSKRLRTYKRLGYSLISNTTLDKQVANAIYDSGNYIDIFEQDIVEAEKRIIISSPNIVQERIDRIIYITKQQVEAGCKIIVITIDPEKMSFGSINDYHEMINQMKVSGIQVVIKDEVDEHFAVIDEELVWHGGMNLLGKEDVWDNLIRIKSAVVAEELLELSFGN
ncbi:TOTE conflict system archaeo-eukaryotic primase domain-containing protein [Lachnoanaerobaculum sp. Marseille-Q4761]|uniref:TOTE conflict system archaeo-eukaryotic primase domain-containing protein n=1 Tax=Lachnoanaerobaculum sp. Marseille-Q4761 TaxID=2819511 RepID=UPI003FA52DD7